MSQEMIDTGSASQTYRRIHKIRPGKNVRIEIRYKKSSAVKYHLKIRTLEDLLNNYYRLHEIKSNNNVTNPIMRTLCHSEKNINLDEETYSRYIRRNCFMVSAKLVMPRSGIKNTILKEPFFASIRGPPL